jgi:enoyl-CoA hydratase
MAPPSPRANWGLLRGSTGKVSKPVIAAAHGAVMAGGFRLVMDSDLVVATRSARFGITEAKRGRGAPWAAPMMTMLPAKVMAEMLFTADSISAERAHALGLVNRLVDDESDLLATAVDLAEGIAQNAPLSVVAAKAMIALASNHGVDRAISLADELYQPVYLSEDAQEGPKAFAEKREPRWCGR